MTAGLLVTRRTWFVQSGLGLTMDRKLGLTGANSALPIWADFMQVALAQHPEWEGDWEMPAGIEQVDINPKTGQLSVPEDTEKRVELFINGTGQLMIRKYRLKKRVLKSFLHLRRSTIKHLNRHRYRPCRRHRRRAE